jgi:hypothetical protein
MLADLVPLCFVTVIGVGTGYLYGRFVSYRIPLWSLALWPVVGVLAALASHAVLGEHALPAYHPVLYMTVFGIVSVVTSRLRNRSANGR